MISVFTQRISRRAATQGAEAESGVIERYRRCPMARGRVAEKVGGTRVGMLTRIEAFGQTGYVTFPHICENEVETLPRTHAPLLLRVRAHQTTPLGRPNSKHPPYSKTQKGSLVGSPLNICGGERGDPGLHLKISQPSCAFFKLYTSL